VGSKVHNGLGLVLVKQGIYGSPVGQVAFYKCSVGMNSVFVPLVEIVKNYNLFSFVDQLLNNDAADIPRAAGN
jgi:hypothetical protein